jgi:hypothetical protein
MNIVFYEEHGVKCYAYDKELNRFYFNDISETGKFGALGSIIQMRFGKSKKE